MKTQRKMNNGLLISFLILMLTGCGDVQAFWPPQLNKEYPAIDLIDQTGQKINMSDFKGSVLIIEYVGMNCPACQAFSGANTEIGPYQNNAVQRGVDSFESFCPLYTGGVKLSDDRITFIQVLLYDMKLGPPTPEDAKKWAQHFRFDKSKKQYVAVPTTDLRGNASYNLIPGFQLVDKNFVLRSDSTGHNPRHSLVGRLLPLVPQLLEE